MLRICTIWYCNEVTSMSCIRPAAPKADPDAPSPRKMPKKEGDLFNSLVKFYESKQYKKGLKIADQILKKFANHGETQSMKALLLHNTGKKEEGYEYIKKGIRNDIRSHICWHAYGLMHRSDNNYREATKCYMNALKIDPENQPILRDLAWLQIQCRELDAFVETKRKMLMLKSGVRQSWVAFAVANYAAGLYEDGVNIISKYNETFIEEGREDAYQESEFILFQNKCIERQGDYGRALAHLNTHTDAIVDKLTWKMKNAEFLVHFDFLLIC